MVNVLLDGTDKPVLCVCKGRFSRSRVKPRFLSLSKRKTKCISLQHLYNWVIISDDGAVGGNQSGLTEKQQYVSQGSFLLKSEIEKGEAEHGH